MPGDRIIRPSAGEVLPGPFEITIRVRSEHTNGVLSVIEETLAPRAFIVPHVHRNDVWVYVVSGEVGVLVDDEIVSASSGEWALKPRDVQHAMWNAKATPARIIELLTPAGSERWFEELAAMDQADEEAFDESCRRHGITFFPESSWVAELRSRFDLD